MYTGPHLTEDNLVFGYDTGHPVVSNSSDTYKFSLGEPTQNITPNYYLAWSTLSGTRTANVIEDSDGVLQAMKLTGTANTQVRTEFTQTNPSQEGYYTFSVEGKRGSSPYIGIYSYMRPYASPYIIYNIDTDTITADTINTHDYGVKYVKDGWYRIWMTVLIRTDQQNRIWKVIQTDTTSPSGGTVGGYVYYAKAQLENKQYVTPFTTGTRSSTQSLIDLKRTTDIDVSNISFDSTGQPTFDGTDDILNTGLFSGRNPSTDPFTIEAIVKSDTTSGSKIWLDATGNGSNQRLYCAHAASGTGNPLGIQSSAWSTSGAIYDTDYHHYVVVMDGSTATLYNNGVSHSTKNYTSYTLSGQLNVGGRSGYRWVGTIPVFKIHNQVLTADQVKQNYNAYKNRFDL